MAKRDLPSVRIEVGDSAIFTRVYAIEQRPARVPA